MSAAYFIRSAKAIEESSSGLPGDERMRGSAEHRAYVSSAILLTVAFLEANINELFSDCADNVRETMDDFPAARDMGLLWRNNVPRTARYKLLEKYDKALELNGKALLNKKDPVVKDIELLTQLRNALMHYEPETVVAFSSRGRSETEIHKFEHKFKGKFELNPLTGLGNAFYPEKLLGCGCAIWAIKTALTFADAFFAAFHIDPTYKHVREMIEGF